MNYNELKDECIICLSDTPDVVKYDAPCECEPYIHNNCLEQWFNANPNICPICKINYEGLGTIQNLELAQRLNTDNANMQRLFILMMLFFSMFIYFEFFY